MALKIKQGLKQPIIRRFGTLIKEIQHKAADIVIFVSTTSTNPQETKPQPSENSSHHDLKDVDYFRLEGKGHYVATCLSKHLMVLVKSNKKEQHKQVEELIAKDGLFWVVLQCILAAPKLEEEDRYLPIFSNHEFDAEEMYVTF